MVPPQFFLTPIPLVLGQFFISRNHDKKIRLSKKAFSLSAFIDPSSARVMSGTVEDDISGQLHKKLNSNITTYVLKNY